MQILANHVTLWLRDDETERKMKTPNSTTNGQTSGGSATDPLQLLTTRDLMALLRLKSRVAVWRLVNKRGAGFPKALLLGERQKRWLRREVEAWLSARPRSAT